MHIGLIGGIGPAATIVYYQRLCAEMRTRGQPLELTIVQADVDELVRNNLADDRDAQAAVYLGLIKRLQAAGADCAAITSLGGHFCYDETRSQSPLPLVSAVEPLDAYFAEQGLKTVGLLGIDVVMRTRLYGQLQHTKAVIPTEDLDLVAETYRNMAIRGACHENERAIFFNAAQRMVDEQNAEAIVLAGTDLGLAFDGYDRDYRVIDALDVHVALLADLACGVRSLEE